MRRLSRLRITIDDLRETGVGKTVNQLSRLEGEVGQYAGKIVDAWKGKNKNNFISGLQYVTIKCKINYFRFFSPHFFISDGNMIQTVNIVFSH